MQDREKGRFFTIFIIPHTEDSMLSFRLPLSVIQLISIALIVILLSSFIWIKSFYGLQEEAAESSRLKQENRILNEKFDLLALETEELIHRLAELEIFSEEVRKVVLETPASEEEVDISFLTAQSTDSGLLSFRGGNQVIDRTVLNLTFLQNEIPEQKAELEILKSDLKEYQEELRATPSIWPTRGRVTSEFGPRNSPFSGRREFHTGIDIAGPRGTPIHATAAGTVVKAMYERGLGNVIEIDHGYGYRTLYAHLSGFTVSAGDEVEKEEQIGLMGSTGASTGPHLHYEVHVNGIAVDPRENLP